MIDLVLTRRAEQDAESARDWYDQQSEGLGDDFLDELRDAIHRAHRDPLHYQCVVEELRRVLLKRFPYAVFYLIEPTRVVVLAVLHQAANPDSWHTL